MKAIIDIILIIIIAMCTWNGYKRGLVGGVAGILAIIISLLGASILSAARPTDGPSSRRAYWHIRQASGHPPPSAPASTRSSMERRTAFISSGVSFQLI